MRSISRLRELLRCKRGNALMVVGAVTPLIIGGAAVGVDTVQVTFAKRTLQRMADSAAIAGTYGVARSGATTGGDRVTAATAAVNRDLALNNNIVRSGMTVSQPTAGTYASDTNAVRVVLTASRRVPFMSFFGRGNMNVEVESLATLVASGRYCVITLATDGTGVEFGGSTEVRLGCGVSSNSTGAEAIRFNGNNAQATASPVAAPGGVPDASRFTGTTTMTLPGSLPVANPFSNFTDPVYPDPTVSPPQPTACGAAIVVQPNTSPPPLEPGCYTGMSLKGNVTLNPGVYYIGSGGLEINSNGTVTGNGVTFLFLQNAGPISVNGGTSITLTAPTTGRYAGMLMQRHSLAPDEPISFSGNSGTTLDGAIYMPGHHVTMTGNAGWGATCLRLVSERATFTGNSLLTNGCTRPNDNGMVAGYVARLVG